MGFPIRTSPDYRLLASPRGFSQLATSFFAYLRQGIHTHALSSLTIKLTLRFTQTSSSPRITSQVPIASGTRSATRSAAVAYWFTSRDNIATCSCPSITIQLSKNKIAWLGLTAKHQKATLNIFRAQRWFLISGRCTLLKLHRASRIHAVLKK